VQTVALHKAPEVVKSNAHEVIRLLESQSMIPKPLDGKRGTRVWTGVPVTEVTRFVSSFRAPSGAGGFDSVKIAEFIEKQVRKGELTHWTVALVGSGTGTEELIGRIGPVGLVKRTPVADLHGNQDRDTYLLRNSNILNPPDQGIDFLDERLTDVVMAGIHQKKVFGESSGDHLALLEQLQGRSASMEDVALELSRLRFAREKAEGRTRKDQKEPTVPYGAVYRDLRPVSRGLLLIYPLDGSKVDNLGARVVYGCALSFPTSNTAEPVEYLVNEMYRRTMLAEVEADVDEPELV
jgi:hypothetical protein